MAGIGHNRGPGLAVHAWRRAQANRPRLSTAAARLQIARAAEIGLPPATYLSLRAVTGRDVEALIFTTQALGLTLGRHLAMPAAVAATLRGVRRCRLFVLAPPGECPEAFLAELRGACGAPFQGAAPMPERVLPWSEARARVRMLLDPDKVTGSAAVLVGEGPVADQLWSAGRLGAILPPGAVFPAGR